LKRTWDGYRRTAIKELCAANASEFTYGTWPTWLSAHELDSKSGITNFPNPTQREIQINMSAGYLQSLKITDLQGKVWLSSTINTSKKIDLQKLPAGVYSVQVGDQTEKLVKL
jgi:hypothetical protein